MNKTIKIYFLYCTSFILLNNELYANNDSLLIIQDSVTENIIIDSFEVVKTSKFLEITEKVILSKTKKPKIQIITNKVKRPDGFGDFLQGFWDFITTPFRPVWGYYEEENMKKEVPYFMFNRMENNNINNK
ncbi:MAG: hypothetical protein ACOYMA_16740 [Bacteroidia bacterium]